MSHAQGDRLAPQTVHKHVLDNGLTVLVKPRHTIPKVSVQLWYNVGSKDEPQGQKGSAHFIEHMIFKGSDNLSESDINEITAKLSGSCNAFTSYDYTGYLFDFPTQHWPMALSLMAECMQSCSFKQDPLNAELKAVIQELKMYRDNYPTILVEQMLATLFPDHPYSHPIIGYKNELIGVTRDQLRNFYRRHYVPNNATLIAVGDIEPEHLFSLAHEAFGPIVPDMAYRKHEFPVHKGPDLKPVVLYRDVQQALVVLAFIVPGAHHNYAYQLEVISWILASGKGSRLHQRLVDELQLVTDVEAFYYDLFDQGVFFIEFQPKHVKDIDRCSAIVHEEIGKLLRDGMTDNELRRAHKQTEMELLSLLESNQKQAYMIGKWYLCTGDEQYLFKFFDHNVDRLKDDVQTLLKTYFVSTRVQVGMVMPLAESEKKAWLAQQELEDQEDIRLLELRTRTTQVEPPRVAQSIEPHPALSFSYPKHQKFKLANGLEILFYHHKNLPKIDMILELKAKHVYDPVDKPGVMTFTSAMLLEGTERYPGVRFAQEIESYGMNVTTAAGFITMSMLRQDLVQGLSMFTQMLCKALIEAKDVEKVRDMIRSDIKNLWDDPMEFSSELIKQHVYRGHPYSKSKIGNLDSIATITRQDLLSCYRTLFSPQQARLAIVGDIEGYGLKELVEKELGSWQGGKVPDLQYPEPKESIRTVVNFPINRDQVVLCFAGLSINRSHPDYDKLLLVDQIFTGGILGSMSSRLFQLREQTGLFYTIGGSLLAAADDQPGMVLIKTLVSRDRVKEAEESIVRVIETMVDSITQEELKQAHNALINSLVDNFENNYQIAHTFLVLERYGLPVDYFDRRAQEIAAIPLGQVQEAARKVLRAERLALFKIGRVE